MKLDLQRLFQLINSKLNIVLSYIENAYIRNYSSKKFVYEIKDCHKNNDGKQIIVAKIVNSPKSVFSMPAIDLVLKRKDILSGFSIDDIVSIVSIVSTEKEPKVIYNKPTIYKYYSLIAMLFGAMLITSNIAASKLILIFGFTMTGGAFCYPFTYVLGNIITEVYGYKRARQLIWGAIICNILLIFFIQLTIFATPSIYWHKQKEFALILGAVPRIVLASLVGYWCGEFVNSYIIAKIKIIYYGRGLLTRILSSSVISITVDTLIFVTIAYTGVMSAIDLMYFTIGVYLKKVLCEFLTIPLTMWVINRLKVAEQVDIFDYNTDFTPFSFNVTYTELNNKLSEYLEENNYESDKSKSFYHRINLSK